MLGVVGGIVAVVVWLVAGRNGPSDDAPATARCEELDTYTNGVACEFEDGSPGRVVTAAELGEEWPLVIDGGILHCSSYSEGFGSVLLDSNGVTYAVNGDARTHARRNGWTDILEIARAEPEAPDILMDWRPLIATGLELCL